MKIEYPTPAFAKSKPSGHPEGMTLRDHFAAAVVPSLIVADDEGFADWEEAKVADWAYRVADAMIERRTR